MFPLSSQGRFHDPPPLPRNPIFAPLPVNMYRPRVPAPNPLHLLPPPLLPHNPVGAGLPVNVVRPGVHLQYLPPTSVLPPKPMYQQYGLPSGSCANTKTYAPYSNMQKLTTVGSAALQPAPSVETTKKKLPSVSPKGFKSYILHLLKNNEPNDAIERWIDALRISFKDSDQFSKEVVRDLVVAVHENSVKDIDKVFDPSAIKKRIPLLNNYLKNDERLKLQAVYALQRLLHELGHPPGLLNEMFEFLYNKDVIDIVTFVRWKKSKDSNEALGKEEALASVQTFFDVGNSNMKKTSSQN